METLSSSLVHCSGGQRKGRSVMPRVSVKKDADSCRRGQLSPVEECFLQDVQSPGENTEHAPRAPLYSCAAVLAPWIADGRT